MMNPASDWLNSGDTLLWLDS